MSARRPSGTAADAVLVVDKPAGWTSHDVVARVRRLAGTRRVGHAGTLDPMATGVLILGIERATRLLGHLAKTDKAYEARIRLGEATRTDDAEGEVVATADASGLTAEAIETAAAALTGPILQVPSSFSAIKVGGERAYARARAGEDVELAARPVTVARFDVGPMRRHGTLVDIDAAVTCTSGTYVRALARDLGRALGVGGHLTMLRRTRVGTYGLDVARRLEELESEFTALPLAEAAAAAFPRRDVSAEEADRLAHGGFLTATGRADDVVAVFGPESGLIALVTDRDGWARPLAVFAAG